MHTEEKMLSDMTQVASRKSISSVPLKTISVMDILRLLVY